MLVCFVFEVLPDSTNCYLIIDEICWRKSAGKQISNVRCLGAFKDFELFENLFYDYYH